jgi:hypothetical protein
VVILCAPNSQFRFAAFAPALTLQQHPTRVGAARGSARVNIENDLDGGR